MNDADNKQKQRRFLEEYSNTLDIKASALAAGYKKQTAVANVRNLLKNPKAVKELKAICDSKAAHLEICPGYIIFGYLKILDWALDLDDYGKPNDAALGLRALDGLVKQLGFSFSDSNAKEPEKTTDMPAIVTSIKGLDPNKI